MNACLRPTLVYVVIVAALPLARLDDSILSEEICAVTTITSGVFSMVPIDGQPSTKIRVDFQCKDKGSAGKHDWWFTRCYTDSKRSSYIEAWSHGILVVGGTLEKPKKYYHCMSCYYVSTPKLVAMGSKDDECKFVKPAT